ncbi:leucine-rich repeat and fibronectin type-III domain-containing protein 5-like [Watersipora subatra]|uniref:leucine-rich repeat and fibronectin type-III domain-containing protein 5-like n=1 Tax=Watersipora subatra TaxID=2589382 RepID=UPI00355ADF74
MAGLGSITRLLLVLYTMSKVVWSTCSEGCLCTPNNEIICRDGSFDSFPNVSSRATKLDLSNSRLASPVLLRSNFTDMQNLEELLLVGCGISRIEYNAFADMSRLRTLDLSFNNLNIISQGALTGLRLRYLFMDNNPTIQLVDGTFSGMTVEVLSLKKCHLTDVQPAIYRPLVGSLRKLLLGENKIERIPQGMLSIFESIETRIHDNPLICDCESKWLKEFYDLNIDTNKIRDPQQDTQQDPRCSSPSSVAGQFFGRLSLDDFSCEKPTLQADISFTRDKGILSCVSSGDPLPLVSWYKPNGIISRSVPQPNQRQNRNEIELLAGEPNVQGQYRCVAVNDGGNISLTVNVDWPFESSAEDTSTVGCKPGMISTTPTEIILTSKDEAETNSQTDMLKIKYFTLVDIIGAILGSFICTLIITVLVLHFGVYRRKKPTQYSTPAMSEYSSSNGSDKNGQYPISLHSLHTSHVVHSQRPLPNKPYTHKMYDENHYMATNVEERDEFLRMQGRVTPSPSCDVTCQACRTIPHAGPS